VQSRGIDYRTLRRHGVNQERLQRLCGYLAANGDRYQASGLAAAAGMPLPPQQAENQLLSGAPWQSVCRMATQVLYDHYGHWALARQSAGAA